jgi:hypothetical protein
VVRSRELATKKLPPTIEKLINTAAMMIALPFALSATSLLSPDVLGASRPAGCAGSFRQRMVRPLPDRFDPGAPLQIVKRPEGSEK